MACNCPNTETCTQQTIGDQVVCNCVVTIEDIVCPDDCTTIILPNGNAQCSCTESVEPTIEKVKTPVSVTDPNYFQDVSWTIAFSPIEQKWVGWYSYCPNYYIPHQNYFQTGINQSSDSTELGIWSHLLTNRSYQVFYGKKYPFLVEYMLKREYGEILLKTVGFEMEVSRYHNEYDAAQIDDKPFNKMWLYSPFTNSGELRLVPNTGQLSLISKYPITAKDGSYQEILITKVGSEYTTNYFYNRMLSHKSNSPTWLWDKNQINKTINTDIVKFSGKTTLEMMRSNVFTVRLEQSIESRLRYAINLLSSKVNLEL